MKGDFSFLALGTAPHYSGVLHQQGRVLLDRDWNDAAAIAAAWRAAAGRDSFGDGVLAVPAANPTAFKLIGASTDGAAVKVDLDAGRAWVDGLSLVLDAPASFAASYFPLPFQAPPAAPATIADGVRDLVVLDVWEDTVSGFQDPLDLIEPALGGPDTTGRTQTFANVKLLRLGPNDDCSAAARLADDFGAKGKLTVSPAPLLTITGDCPLEAGGGYTGLEHYLYRIEIADPDSTGAARFKWSQWNGGLVGRGLFTPGAAGEGTVTISANDQMINHCGVTVAGFYLEALRFDATLGSWSTTLTASATLAQDGVLALTNITGAWPASAPTSGFFRLWNGIALVAGFPSGGANPAELELGIRLEFDAAAPGNTNYQPGDYWTFPVRAAGAAFEPPVWPTAAPPQGVRHHRVALGILNWNGTPAISFAAGDIEDCRRVFGPLTNQKLCCTFNVGDGRTSHGDFDSIEEAIRHLPAAGGEICLLPGLHTTNAVIEGRQNVKVKGCGATTKVMPRSEGAAQPIFTIRDAQDVSIVQLDMVTLGGMAILADARQPGGSTGIEVGHNRVLAWSGAVRMYNVKGANIHHNRIRMLDKRGGGDAIYLTGVDSMVERNDIRLVPAPLLPPIVLPSEPTPQNPNDPCARLGVIYVNPRLFARYVDTVWHIVLPELFVPEQPYNAAGGIRLGGGSERVRVLENAVAGGAGNGVTLGSAPAAPATTPEREHDFTLPREADIAALVLGPDHKPRAGVTITLTDKATNNVTTFVSDAVVKFIGGSNPATFRVTEMEPGFSIDSLDLRPMARNKAFQLTITLKADAAPPPDSAFLYDIAIERNDIAAMALSGIGVEPAHPRPGPVQSALAVGTSVAGLAIRGNRIRGCLLERFDSALRATVATQGLGGISLGACEALAIVGNDIEANGVTGVNPVCGIFVLHGDEVEIAHNRVAGNGPLGPNVTTDNLIAGKRGGIVLNLVANFNQADAGALAQGDTASLRPAARIHHNTVDQPVGMALYAAAFGPVHCTDNAFSSELSGASPLERAAGTAYLFGLHGTQNAPAVQVLPPSNVIFSDNQLRTGRRNTSATCQMIGSIDDLAYQDNQSFSLAEEDLFANAYLYGDTLRATGNRLGERARSVQQSLLSLGVRLNNTSFNQGDHCVIATATAPGTAEVTVGNQVLTPGPRCQTLSQIVAGLFKAKE